jgi:hypothetical protein
MIKKSFFCAIFALLVMVFVSGCSQDGGQVPVVEDISSMTSEQVIKEVMPVLQEFLNAQYDYVIGKDKTPQWDKYLSSDATGSDVLKAEIDEMKENRYWYNTSRIIAYSSKISTDETSFVVSSGNTWILQHFVEKATTTEVSEYNLDKPVMSIFGTLPYDFTMIKEGGKWLIQSYSFLGYFPDMPNPRWYFERPERQYNPDEWNASDVSMRSISYNRNNAKQYAINHVYACSANYPDYTNYGGDCTNFVSQCLEAGGWTQTSKSAGRGSSSSWYHDPGYTSAAPTSARSASWTDAGYFQNFLNNSTRVASNFASYPSSSYQIGDIIQLASSGIAYHSTIITSIEGGIIKVTARTANVQDVNINDFSGTKLYYKIANSY